MEQEKGDLNFNIMDTEIKNNNITDTDASEAVAVVTPNSAPSPDKKFNSARPPFKSKPAFGQRPSGGDRAKNPRRNTSGKGERVKPEFDQKILDIRRVTRVTKGGKRMNFSVSMVVGDKKGSVGVGTGKANDTSVAIDKAYRNAKRNILRLNLTKTMSIPHEVGAKYCSGKVSIMPASGRGVSAGSALKNVIELAGIKDVTAKIISPSKNKLNISRAALLALSAFDKNKFANQVKKEADKEAVM
jgi:small subunit ribosomal protein S5